MASKKNKTGNCAYCGQYNDHLTEEHVIQQGLFLHNDIPSDMIVIYICKACERRKSVPDRYFIEMLAAEENVYTAQSTMAQLARKEKEKNPRHKETSQFLKDLATAQDISPIQISLGQLPGKQLPRGHIKDAIKTMTRGLYYWATNQRLPDDAVIYTTFFTEPLEFLLDWDNWKKIGAKEINVGRGDVFQGLYIFEDSPNTSISLWKLRFYEGLVFFAATNPPILPADYSEDAV